MFVYLKHFFFNSMYLIESLPYKINVGGKNQYFQLTLQNSRKEVKHLSIAFFGNYDWYLVNFHMNCSHRGLLWHKHQTINHFSHSGIRYMYGNDIIHCVTALGKASALFDVFILVYLQPLLILPPLSKRGNHFKVSYVIFCLYVFLLICVF